MKLGFEFVFNLFFPERCQACSKELTDNEHIICTQCRHDLPLTNYHFTGENAFETMLYGRAKIEAGTALLKFEKKGLVQHLIHQLKYKNQQSIGVFLGHWLGEELKTITPYNTIDIVIPVPLHKKKLKKRGYNQVEKFGQSLAKKLQATYTDKVLVKIENTDSQVFKNRQARTLNKPSIYKLKNINKITNKHILLVDDIITTGATMEACYNTLKNVENIKISMATMAITLL